MSEAIRNTIVAIIAEAGRLPVPAETLTDEADLYQAGLTSFASVQLMLAIEDRFGVCWQIVPTVLVELLQDEDAKKSESIMKALLQMKKLDIAGLKRAHEQQ